MAKNYGKNIGTAENLDKEPGEPSPDKLHAEDSKPIESAGAGTVKAEAPSVEPAKVEESLDARVARYVVEAASTEGDKSDDVLYFGLCGEAGEMLDYAKKCLGHGKPYSRELMVKEIGDYAWYCAALQRKYGRKNVSIEPFMIVGNLAETAVALMQQTAGFSPTFMSYDHGMAVTERLSRCFSLAVMFLGEMEIKFNGREGISKALFEADIKEILDSNAAKLATRYPGGFSAQGSAERKDLT